MYSESTVPNGIQIYRHSLPEKNARVFGKMVAYNNLSNLNVLITGGAGFIGSHVINKVKKLSPSSLTTNYN
ncbi:FlaA1/EpsC-like NDP-sugar epimerase [Methanolobus bombayensis]|nr:FlaA1/EpsC-like NDP-sugar epimerase [Methanolobus bombayensis]